MSNYSHGQCIGCKEYCGCSFNPVSKGDYCSYHSPYTTAPLKSRSPVSTKELIKKLRQDEWVFG